MPPPTFEPRIRVIMTRRHDGKRDGQSASVSKTCTIHGCADEKWLMDTFLAYIDFLSKQGYPISVVQNNSNSSLSEKKA